MDAHDNWDEIQRHHMHVGSQYQKTTNLMVPLMAFVEIQNCSDGEQIRGYRGDEIIRIMLQRWGVGNDGNLLYPDYGQYSCI